MPYAASASPFPFVLTGLLLALSRPAHAELMLQPDPHRVRQEPARRPDRTDQQRQQAGHLPHLPGQPPHDRDRRVRSGRHARRRANASPTPCCAIRRARSRCSPARAQTVRVMLRKPADLAEGEYRSHLQFEKLPEPTAPPASRAAARRRSQIGVVLNALVGASIPVIVRQGRRGASVTLAGLALQAGDAASRRCWPSFERDGNRSVYGDVSRHLHAAGGKPQHAGAGRRHRRVHAQPLRQAALPLQLPAGVTLAAARCAVSYRDRPKRAASCWPRRSLDPALSGAAAPCAAHALPPLRLLRAACCWRCRCLCPARRRRRPSEPRPGCWKCASTARCCPTRSPPTSGRRCLAAAGRTGAPADAGHPRRPGAGPASGYILREAARLQPRRGRRSCAQHRRHAREALDARAGAAHRRRHLRGQPPAGAAGCRSTSTLDMASLALDGAPARTVAAAGAPGTARAAAGRRRRRRPRDPGYPRLATPYRLPACPSSTRRSASTSARAAAHHRQRATRPT